MNSFAMNTGENYTSDRVLDTIIVGGGQAGLALGYFLSRQGRDFAILDAGQRVGDAWRQRWDSLRVFTPAKYDGLPGMPFPGDGLAFPGKDEVADYLEGYAALFGLPVRLGVKVEHLRQEDGHYVAEAGAESWKALNVVVATGACVAPKVPGFAAQLDESVFQVHSSLYRNPAQLRPGPVLVVGVGNSGAEIALELSRSHHTLLAGKPTAELPVKHGRAAARFFLPIVRFAGLHILTLGTPIGRKAAPGFLSHGTPLIRTKLRDLAAAGVERVPRITGVRDGRPVAEDGSILDVDNVIWCTGYRDDFGWMEPDAFDGDGRPRQYRGVAQDVPGLFFMGQEFLYAATSATLPGLARDAGYLARRIPRRGIDSPGDRAGRSPQKARPQQVRGRA
ncbi:flavin-containing monooxygenase [Arthrobacter celericrescens]|uniref:flavin-containing monooxygenase n=1 Tax=Arthrobacter celericrescens TaxID=2320851 RepID=UPI001FE02414|nr:NAD(P)-binding domain-containing protein [Arthrobacter celericrescens]